MPVTAETLTLQQQLNTQVQSIVDAQTRALTAAWVVAWAEVSADLRDTLLDLLAAGGTVSRATMLRSVRLRSVLGQVADQLTTLADDAGVRITSDLQAVVDDAAKAQARIVASQLPARSDLALAVARTGAAEDKALEAIVHRSTQQITSRTRELSPAAYDAVRRELIRGVAVGSNPRATARRMVARTEGQFNGGLTRALTIARTETLDAHRTAAAVSQAQHTDVLTGWVWLCHLGPRTCPACLARHGTLHTADEAGPHGHQCCRCSRMPKTQSWADLGFDGLDEPDDQLPDAKAWFDALPEADQLAIMGPERLRLLRAGDIAWADLATLKSSDGWRDAWHVTPVSVLAQRSRSRGRAAS